MLQHWQPRYRVPEFAASTSTVAWHILATPANACDPMLSVFTMC